MKMKRIAPLLCLALCLLASACAKDEEDPYIQHVTGKFFLLDEPFDHNHAPYTIKACITTGTLYLDIRGYALTGNMPKWASVGDTVEVEATLKELYPRDQITNCEASNISVYRIKKIKKIS